MQKQFAYIRKLYNQELGFRGGEPHMAGRYFFVSKEYTGYFPPLSEVVKNDFTVINMIPPNSNNIVLTKYVYHNSKVSENKPNGRDEYRIYMNPALDPNRDYFKINDIVVIYNNLNEENVGKIYYKIYHFPAHEAGRNYKHLEEMLHRYASSRAKSTHALVPISELSFVSPHVFDTLDRRVIPKLIQNAVLDTPVQLIPEDQMKKQFVFTRHIRREAFQDLVKFFYEYKCAVTGTSINYKDLYNIVAAHIIPDSHRGPAHPKNGISLCRDMHWAFDKGFFTIRDDYRIKIHEEVKELPVLTPLQDRKIFLPSDKRAWPSEISLKYHRENIFGIFMKSA